MSGASSQIKPDSEEGPLFLIPEAVVGAPTLAASDGLDHGVLEMEIISKDFPLLGNATPQPSQKDKSALCSVVCWEGEGRRLCCFPL